MGFSPESYTFMTMGRLHRADRDAKPQIRDKRRDNNYQLRKTYEQ